MSISDDNIEVITDNNDSMARKSLIDRTVEKSMDTRSLGSTADRIVSDLCTKSNKIKYKCLNDGNWNELCTFEQVARKNIDDIVKDENLSVFNSEREELEEFSLICSSSWDDDKEMFRIQPTYDQDGHLSSLIVPLESEISDDIKVVDIHNGKGEFVADDIERQIDCEMHELQTNDMFIEDGKYVYKEGKTRLEIFSDTLDKQNLRFLSQQGSFTDWTLGTLFLSIVSFVSLYLMGQIATLFISNFTTNSAPTMAYHSLGFFILSGLYLISSGMVLNRLSVASLSAIRAIANNKHQGMEQLFEV